MIEKRKNEWYHRGKEIIWAPKHQSASQQKSKMQKTSTTMGARPSGSATATAITSENSPTSHSKNESTNSAANDLRSSPQLLRLFLPFLMYVLQLCPW
jgi:hypothetical protein